MAAAAGSSNTRVVFVLVGLFALILAISSTQVLAAKDLADHRKATKTTTTATTQEEMMVEMDRSKKNSGSVYGSFCSYGCCSRPYQRSRPCHAKLNCPGGNTGVPECTRCCSSADEARNAAYVNP